MSDKTLDKGDTRESPDRESQVRDRAYRLWEEEGRPHGRDVEFWERARELVAAEGTSKTGGPKIVSPDPEAEVEAAVSSAPGEEREPPSDQEDRSAAPRARRKR